MGGQFTTKISPHYQKALEYLNRAPPDSNFLLIFYLIYQFIRHLMHKLEIGVWTEKSIIQLKGATPEFGKLGTFFSIFQLFDFISNFLKIHKFQMLLFIY